MGILFVGEQQVLRTSFGSDTFSGHRSGLEETKLVGGGNVEHMKPRACQPGHIHGCLRGLEAGLVVAYHRMESYRQILTVARHNGLTVGLYGSLVLGMDSYERRHLAEYTLYHLAPLHKHVAGG